MGLWADHGVVWCGVLCCAVLCCAVVCCGVLWCAVLWCGVHCTRHLSTAHTCSTDTAMNAVEEVDWIKLYNRLDEEIDKAPMVKNFMKAHVNTRFVVRPLISAFCMHM